MMVVIMFTLKIKYVSFELFWLVIVIQMFWRASLTKIVFEKDHWLDCNHPLLNRVFVGLQPSFTQLETGLIRIAIQLIELVVYQFSKKRKLHKLSISRYRFSPSSTVYAKRCFATVLTQCRRARVFKFCRKLRNHFPLRYFGGSK